jgi:hypothetical protein
VGVALLASLTFRFRDADDAEREESVYLVTMRVCEQCLAVSHFGKWTNGGGLCVEQLRGEAMPGRQVFEFGHDDG